jgi:hypothetical protein
MPEGSSSAAPVMRPGPSAAKNRRTNRRRGSAGGTACPRAASTPTEGSLLFISFQYCASANSDFLFKDRARDGGLHPNRRLAKRRLRR